MTIRLLRTLIAVSETKSFSEAAERVHITHAAISQQMKTLEDHLGVVLFDRSSRPPTLTPIAQQVIKKARKIVEDYDNLAKPDQLEDIFNSEVNLGVIPTTLTGLTPKAIGLVKSCYPNMKIHVKSGLTATLMADIGRGTVDAAIVSKPHLMPSKVAFHHIAEEEMKLFVAEEETETDPMKLFQEKPFIRFNRSEVIGNLIDNWIASKNIPIVETMELDSGEAIAGMVSAGLGISILPDAVVKSGYELPLKKLSLGEGAPLRTLGLVYRDDNIKIHVIKALEDAMDQIVKSAE